MLSPLTWGITAFVALGLLAFLSVKKRTNALRNYVAAQGWNYLGASNPIPEEVWEKFCRDHQALRWRRDFVLGTCRGTEFLLFETRWVDTSQVLYNAGTIAMIAFRRPDRSNPVMRSSVFEGQDYGWWQYEAPGWVFLSQKTSSDPFRFPGPSLLKFVEAATTVFRGVYG